MVSNRLRWLIATNEFVLPSKTALRVTVSVSFARIGGRISDRALIDECDAALDNVEASTTNVLIEVDEASKGRAPRRETKDDR
jgi:hypothetical protein